MLYLDELKVMEFDEISIEWGLQQTYLSLIACMIHWMDYVSADFSFYAKTLTVIAIRIREQKKAIETNKDSP